MTDVKNKDEVDKFLDEFASVNDYENFDKLVEDLFKKFGYVAKVSMALYDLGGMGNSPLPSVVLKDDDTNEEYEVTLKITKIEEKGEDDV